MLNAITKGFMQGIVAAMRLYCRRTSVLILASTPFSSGSGLCSAVFRQMTRTMAAMMTLIEKEKGG